MKFKETEFYKGNKEYYSKRKKKGNAYYWAGAVAFLGGLYALLRGEAITNYSKGVENALDATDGAIVDLEYQKEEPIETTGETVDEKESES